MDGMLLYSGIAVFWVLAWFLSLDGAKADYNGGSLNSVNGTNLVKSVYCLQPCGSSCAQVHGNTWVDHVQKQWLRKKVILCFIKVPLPRQSIIHKQYPTCRVAKDLMWYRNTFTYFHHIMHLTLDPFKRRAEHQSPSVHSHLHSGPYSVSGAAHKPFCWASTLTSCW